VLRNGLYLVAGEAARRSGVELALAHRDALVLGSLREDILWIRGLGILTEYPSFRHFGGRILIGFPGVIHFHPDGAPQHRKRNPLRTHNALEGRSFSLARQSEVKTQQQIPARINQRFAGTKEHLHDGHALRLAVLDDVRFGIQCDE
jgi:hypothetical protein